MDSIRMALKGRCWPPVLVERSPLLLILNSLQGNANISIWVWICNRPRPHSRRLHVTRLQRNTILEMIGLSWQWNVLVNLKITRRFSCRRMTSFFHRQWTSKHSWMDRRERRVLELSLIALSKLKLKQQRQEPQQQARHQMRDNWGFLSNLSRK